tara:strand:- start:11509 stop:12642 length:1134 start_codon:yes stop_codon:yes gene_type:complete
MAGFVVGKYQASPLMAAFKQGSSIKSDNADRDLKEAELKSIDDYRDSSIRQGDESHALAVEREKLVQRKYDEGAARRDVDLTAAELQNQGSERDLRVKAQTDNITDASMAVGNWMEGQKSYNMSAFEALKDNGGLFIQDDSGKTVINPQAEELMRGMGTSKIQAAERERAMDFLKNKYKDIPEDQLYQAIENSWGKIEGDQTTAMHNDLNQYLLTAYDREQGELSGEDGGRAQFEDLLSSNSPFFNLMNRGVGHNNLYKLFENDIKLTGNENATRKWRQTQANAADPLYAGSKAYIDNSGIPNLDARRAKAEGWEFDTGNVSNRPDYPDTFLGFGNPNSEVYYDEEEKPYSWYSPENSEASRNNPRLRHNRRYIPIK